MKKRNLTKQVALLLSEESYRLLMAITNKREISVSEFIRESVEKELRRVGKEVSDELDI